MRGGVTLIFIRRRNDLRLRNLVCAPLPPHNNYIRICRRRKGRKTRDKTES
jgi:hypothetical protein